MSRSRRLLFLSACVALASCGATPRRGGLGESCRATDDCETPLVCRTNVCTTVDGSDGGLDASTSDGGPDAAASTDTGAGDTGPVDPCGACLETACTAQEAACGAECVAIEACIELLCGNLSAIGSSDEGACQVMCQQAHTSGRPAHLDLAGCANAASCASCAAAPAPLDACRQRRNATSCADELAACDASSACLAYRSCVAACTTLSACTACDDANVEGQTIAEAYGRCVAAACTAEAWVP